MAGTGLLPPAPAVSTKPSLNTADYIKRRQKEALEAAAKVADRQRVAEANAERRRQAEEAEAAEQADAQDVDPNGDKAMEDVAALLLMPAGEAEDVEPPSSASVLKHTAAPELDLSALQQLGLPAESAAAALPLMLSDGDILLHLGASEASLRLLLNVAACSTSGARAVQAHALLLRYYDAIQAPGGPVWVPTPHDFLQLLLTLGCSVADDPAPAPAPAPAPLAAPLPAAAAAPPASTKRRRGGASAAAFAAAPAPSTSSLPADNGAGPSNAAPPPSAAALVEGLELRMDNVRLVLGVLARLCRDKGGGAYGPAWMTFPAASQASTQALATLLMRLHVDPAVTRVAYVELQGALEGLMSRCDPAMWSSITPGLLAGMCPTSAASIGPFDYPHRIHLAAVQSVPGTSHRASALRQRAALLLVRRLLPAHPQFGPGEPLGEDGTQLDPAAVHRELVSRLLVRRDGERDSAAPLMAAVARLDQPGDLATQPDFWRLFTVLQAFHELVWGATHDGPLARTEAAVALRSQVRPLTKAVEDALQRNRTPLAHQCRKVCAEIQKMYPDVVQI